MKRGARHQNISPDDAFAIPEVEWNAAECFFDPENSQKSPTKMAKKDPILHSFIRLNNNEIIGLANKKIDGILGEGNFGVVVKGQKRDRSVLAIKIEAGKKRSPKNKQVQLMKRIGFHLGETDRTLPKKKIFKGKLTKSKRYTAYAYLKGKELAKQIKALNQEQKYIVAMKCCEALMELHQKRIIHVDVKPENFIADIQGNNIVVKPCDFDFSLMLPEGQDCLELNYWCGTTAYMAPEIGKHLEISTYSFAADIYSLGMMFKKDLKLPKEIYQQMIQHDRTQRCSLESTHERLRSHLGMIAGQAKLNTDTTDEPIEPKTKKRKKRT